MMTTLRLSPFLIHLHLQGCHNLPSISPLPSATLTTPSISTFTTPSTSPSTSTISPMATPDLAVTLWRAYPDTAVFDWLITLQEKQAMVGCTLTYGLLYITNQTWLVENF